VRPSSGAETLEHETASEMPDALEPAEVAAAEDGRSPVNRYLACPAFFWLAHWVYPSSAAERQPVLAESDCRLGEKYRQRRLVLPVASG